MGMDETELADVNMSPGKAKTPGSEGVTTPEGAMIAHAIKSIDTVGMMMEVQGKLGEVTNELKHLATAIGELKQKVDGSTDAMKSSVESSVGGLRTDLRTSIDTLEGKVESLSHWRTGILAGAAVVAFFFGLIAWAIHEFRDEIHFGRETPAVSASVTQPSAIPPAAAH